MRAFTLLVAAAAATIVLPTVRGPVEPPAGNSPAVRDAGETLLAVHSRGRPVRGRPTPASTSKSATPHPRLSLMAAVERSKVREATPGEAEDPTTAALNLTPADAIGWCESRNRYDAENPDSSASGRWQFIAATWRAITGLEPPASAWPPSVQRRAFLALWNDGRGARHWAPSRHCWEPLLTGAADG